MRKRGLAPRLACVKRALMVSSMIAYLRDDFVNDPAPMAF
jgi:hypothetical protein